MELPEFLTGLPQLGAPFPSDVVKTHALHSDDGLMVIFEVLQDIDLPMHSHKAQWGTVLEGRLELTIGDDTQVYLPGQSYSIPSGALHGGKISAGSKLLDIFEEADRYTLKRWGTPNEIPSPLRGRNGREPLA
jgi:quercetin dioxygenase-like cupin family protein